MGVGFFALFNAQKNNNLLTRFELGATYLIDIDPDSLQKDEEPLDAVGFDVGFPIIERDSFRLDLYDDIVMINPPPNPEDFALESIAAKEKSKPHSENAVNELGWG